LALDTSKDCNGSLKDDGRHILNGLLILTYQSVDDLVLEWKRKSLNIR
jgi:hypothetical protein